MPLAILAVGDLHLGRKPTRLPRALGERGAALGPAGAWQRIVAAAIDKAVDAVTLSGDVVERDQDFFEAYRHLRTGVESLTAAGIRVIAITGNHDGGTLPRLADEMAGFELLGRDGAWQRTTLEAQAEIATLWGWSYPRSGSAGCPLTGTAFEPGPGPNLGLLHCDRDQPESAYAPVSSQYLRAASLDAWLLGHIHRPDTLSVTAPHGYLGSATGLDPGEPGPHGPWLVNIHSGRISGCEPWPLAPLRWEALDVDLTGITELAAARTRLLEALHELDKSIQDNQWRPEAVGVRLRFTGRARFAQADILGLIPEDQREHLYERNGVHYFAERLIGATFPEIPLETLAQRSDPPGLLAHRLLVLQRPRNDSEREALVRQARHHLERIAEQPRWQPATSTPLTDAAITDWLERAARQGLAQLLEQRGEA